MVHSHELFTTKFSDKTRLRSRNANNVPGWSCRVETDVYRNQILMCNFRIHRNGAINQRKPKNIPCPFSRLKASEQLSYIQYTRHGGLLLLLFVFFLLLRILLVLNVEVSQDNTWTPVFSLDIYLYPAVCLSPVP